MEAPEVACPGSRCLTRRRFGLPPSRFGAPDFSVADRWSGHLLPEKHSFLAGLEQAQQRQRDGRAFFFFFPSPTNLQSLWQLLGDKDAFVGYQVRSRGRAVVGSHVAVIFAARLCSSLQPVWFLTPVHLGDCWGSISSAA